VKRGKDLRDGMNWIAPTGQNHFSETYSEGDALGYYGSGRWPELFA
jgi:hypothetical protein